MFITEAAFSTFHQDYFLAVLKDFTDALGIRYGFVVAEGGRERFRVDPDDVLRTVDLADV